MNEKNRYKMYKAGKHWLFAGVAIVSIGIGGGILDVTTVSADTTLANSTTGTTGITGITGQIVTPSDTSSTNVPTSTPTQTSDATSTMTTVPADVTQHNTVQNGGAVAPNVPTPNPVPSVTSTGVATNTVPTGSQSSSNTTTTSTANLINSTDTSASSTNLVTATTASTSASQKNADGKTQYSALPYAQSLQLKANVNDDTVPTTNVGSPKVYQSALGNVPSQYQSDEMTGNTLWEYSGNTLFNKGAYIQKDWANSGLINGKVVNFHEKFHDFVAQPDSNNSFGYKIVVSDNAVDNVDVYNMNFQETFWFTYADGTIVPISQMSSANAANNNNSMFYFMSASLSSSNAQYVNRREYAQTSDAKTVIISKDPIVDTQTGFSSRASTIGLQTISGANTNNAYTNTDPNGYQSHSGEDLNPDYFALQGGVTFADFTSDTPTLFLGAVPIQSGQTWWHGNHNKNTDMVSFIHFNVVDTRQINETINYVDQDNKVLSPKSQAEPVTFITIKSWDNELTSYYKLGAQTTPALDANGVPDMSWTKSTDFGFVGVINPTINNYHVISNDAPNSSFLNVNAQTVDNNGNDLNFTVVYAPNYAVTAEKEINERISYVDQLGNILTQHTALPVNFVTITNPITGNGVTYYKVGETQAPILNNYGQPDSSWIMGNQTTFPAVTNPEFVGFHVESTTDTANDLTQTTPQLVISNSSDINLTIVYTPNAEVANVKYIDDTSGATLSTQALSGAYNTTDAYRTSGAIANYGKQGYELVSDNYPATGVVYNQDGTVQSFEVHLVHGTTPVGPNNPAVPGEPINPANPDGPKWPAGTDKASLTQTITRTINYYDKQTNAVVATPVVEGVTYNRTAIVDKVTGAIIGYATTGGDQVDQTDGTKAWVAEGNQSQWAAVTSPDLSAQGYTAPDQAGVAEASVAPDSKDAVVNVYYDHVIVPVNPSQPEVPGEPTAIYGSNHSIGTTQSTFTDKVENRVIDLPKTGVRDTQTGHFIGILVLGLTSLVGLLGFKRKQK